MQKLAREYPAKDLHVILDNSSAHKTPDVMAWKAHHPRVTFHFTPTSASWLNHVEGFFSILTRRSLRRTSFVNRSALKKHLRDFLAAWNANPTPFVWTKSAHTIVRDHRRMLDRISREEHWAGQTCVWCHAPPGQATPASACIARPTPAIPLSPSASPPRRRLAAGLKANHARLPERHDALAQIAGLLPATHEHSL